jgi:hypothetical protein
MLGAEYSPEPLDREEQARVRRLQIACKAVKRCESCGETRPVHQFPRYGSTQCEACAELPVLETWWPQQKSQLAAAS